MRSLIAFACVFMMFAAAVDAQVYQASKQTAATSGQRSVAELVAGLADQSRRRFELLRAR